MTTVSQIITDAYQYNNIVALSVIPNAAEQNKALRYLNRIFRSIFDNELGERLRPVNVGRNNVVDITTAPMGGELFAPIRVPTNARLVLNLETPTEVYLPFSPQDGQRFAVQDLSNNLGTNPLTIKGNGRLIEGAEDLVINTSGANLEWFYREDLGTWVKIADLLLGDVFPLPTEFEEFFITMLALRLGASEDIDLNNQLSFVLKDAVRKLRSRYRQTVVVGPEYGIVRTPFQPKITRYF